MPSAVDLANRSLHLACKPFNIICVTHCPYKYVLLHVRAWFSTCLNQPELPLTSKHMFLFPLCWGHKLLCEQVRRCFKYSCKSRHNFSLPLSYPSLFISKQLNSQCWIQETRRDAKAGKKGSRNHCYLNINNFSLIWKLALNFAYK